MLSRLRGLSCAVLALAGFGQASEAHAGLWCAAPLIVHEWGVQVFDASGAALPGEALPGFFHEPGKTMASPPQVPVRDLPADNGMRKLPVMHFYSQREQVPLGLEVGFSQGRATSWFPDVDQLGTGRRQLVWSRLDLAAKPVFGPAKTTSAWVEGARKLAALWVNGPRESERFVYYEGRTREQVPLVVRRAAGWTASRRKFEIANTGSFAVHDVLFVHREGKATYVHRFEQIAAGGSATFDLGESLTEGVSTATVGALQKALTDPATPVWMAPERPETCVMGRNPADAFSRAEGHRLYRDEVDLLLSYWNERFFGGQGTRIVYREDTAYLDEVMPLNLYTDMYNYIVLRRAGLALWSGVVLP